MARPKKIGIPYFSLDTDFFEDPKIKILISKYGSDGIAIYLKIICSGYKESGYYLSYSEDTAFILSAELGITFEKLNEVIEFMCSKNLFNAIQKHTNQILTCERMQLQYLAGTERRSEVFFDSKHLIIDPMTAKSKNHKAKIIIDGYCITKTELLYNKNPKIVDNNPQSERESESKEKEKEVKVEAELFLYNNNSENKNSLPFSFNETLKKLFKAKTKITDPNQTTHLDPILKFFSQIPENMTEKDIEACINDAFSALNPSINVRIDYLCSNIQAKITAKNEEIIKNLKKKEADEAALLRKKSKELEQQHNKEDTLQTLSTYKTFFTENPEKFNNREKAQLLEHFKKGEILKAGMIIEPKMKKPEEPRLLKTTLEEKS